MKERGSSQEGTVELSDSVYQFSMEGLMIKKCNGISLRKHGGSPTSLIKCVLLNNLAYLGLHPSCRMRGWPAITLDPMQLPHALISYSFKGVSSQPHQ